MRKTCSRCNRRLPVSSFYKASRRKDGLQSACKHCCDLATAESRHRDKELYLALRRKAALKAKLRVDTYKVSKGCYSCKETFAPCLEFHHLDPNKKEYAIGTKRAGKWESLEKELSKCIVVCANCHRKIHYGVLKIDKAKIEEV